MDVKAILVPTDFSEHSDTALSWALEMAKKWQAKITLLHVVPSFQYSPTVMDPHFDILEFERRLQADAEAGAQAQIERLDTKSAPVGITVRIGEPFHDICELAKAEHIDVIVMGSHGRTGMGHLLLGSVAERVVRHASCPVLVTRKTAVSLSPATVAQ